MGRDVGLAGDLLTGHAVVLHRGASLRVPAATRRPGSASAPLPGTGSPPTWPPVNPLQVAGSLTIDGYRRWFVDGIDGDHSSGIGMPLPPTRRLLGALGISVTELWRQS